MTTSRSPALLAAAAVVLGVCANAQTRIQNPSSSATAHNYLSLDFENNGQSVAATVGEQIELTLGLVGGQYYGAPQISSAAIEFEGTSVWLPPNMPPPPGGSTSIYMFEAVNVGEAQVKLPVAHALDPETARTREFSVTIQVGEGVGNRSLRATLTIDQVNTESWEGLWANAVSSPRKDFLPTLSESFMPSLAKLTAVDVELLVAHPGPPAIGDIEMTIFDGKKMRVADVWKSVSTNNCNHVLFLLPKGGAEVSPGQQYTIQLFGVDSVFGWKYVVGGYRKGAASAQFGSNPPLPDTRSTFLFATFGTN